MNQDGISPDDVTFVSSSASTDSSTRAIDRAFRHSYTYVALLKSCTKLKDLEKGRGIHAQISKMGFERDILIGSATVDMYCKSGALAEARHILEMLPARDAISWNIVIAGYSEHRLGEEAFSCFEKMKAEGISPCAVTFACILKACGIRGALVIGKELHTEITKRCLERQLFVSTALVDMYAKCGSTTEARKVFDSVPDPGAVLWNALINGYSENHEVNLAVQCFEDMEEQGVKPDATTFTCLLAACSHTSLVLKGQEYFQKMREYGIEPRVEHYSCMVDLLARSGLVYEAERLAEAMQFLSCEEILEALLSACRSYGEVEVGVRCFHRLVEGKQEDAAAYSLMVDIYASAGRWSDASKLEEIRNFAGVKKKLVSASIEVNKRSYYFMAGDSQREDVLLMLESLSSHSNISKYIPILDMVSRHHQ